MVGPLPLQAGLIVGVEVALSANSGMITGNRISTIRQFNPGSAAGIYLAANSTGSNLTVANNFISDLAGASFLQSPDLAASGITVVSGAGYKIVHNSVLLNTNLSTSSDPAPRSAAITITNGVVAFGAINLRNNILANMQTVGNRYAVFCNAPAEVFSAIANNDYFAQNVGFGGGSALPTLADWQMFTLQDANSVAADPMFVNTAAPADLHLQATSLLVDAGIPVGITTDIDGETRDAQPDIGADEIDGLDQCSVCHKGALTLILSCNSLDYQRHLDHSDVARACP